MRELRKLKITIWKILTGRRMNPSEHEANLCGALRGTAKFQNGQWVLTPMGRRMATDFANQEGLSTVQ